MLTCLCVWYCAWKYCPIVMLFVPMIVILGYLELMVQTRTEQRLDSRSVGGWRTASICLSKDAQDTSCASCSLVFARSWLVALQGNESFSFLVLHEYLRVNSSTTPIPHQVGCASGYRDSTAVSCDALSIGKWLPRFFSKLENTDSC